MDESDTALLQTNWLLRAYPPTSRRKLARKLELVHLEFKDLVCQEGDAISHVYFPCDTILSLLTVMEDGLTIETAVVGREGVFGLLTFPVGVSPNRCIAQLRGRAFRGRREILQEEMSRSDSVRRLTLNYLGAMLAQVQQTAACNALHSVEQRMSRVLMMMQDRAEGRTLPYTQEFMATILGASRKSITAAAQVLEDMEAISYGRAAVQVLDKEKLQAAACGCYSADRQRFDALQSTMVEPVTVPLLASDVL